MTAISYKEILTTIKKFNKIAPFRRTTRSNRERYIGRGIDFEICRRRVDIYRISFSVCKRMIMSFLDYNGWFIIHLGETASNKSDNSMFEIFGIIK
jgi:hypothetical protein